MQAESDIFNDHVGNIAPLKRGYLSSDSHVTDSQTKLRFPLGVIDIVNSSDDFLWINDLMDRSSLTMGAFERPQMLRHYVPKTLDKSPFLYDSRLEDRHANHATLRPSWLGDFDSRIEELREVAVEENLPLSEDSAVAARAFCESYGRSIKPSVFLVGNGNFRLVWENKKGEQIGLQFRADLAIVQCVFFKIRQDGMSTITALETNSGLIDILVDNRLLHILGKK